MINDTLPITFGVELEMVFAFHESLLQAYLSKTNSDAAIVKDIIPSERTYLNQRPLVYKMTRPQYVSWGLTGTARSPHSKQSSDGKFRAYEDEPLHVANKLLPSQVAYVHYGQKKATRFDQWHLTNDASLTGADKQTLLRKLKDRIPNLDAANDCKLNHNPNTPGL